MIKPHGSSGFVAKVHETLQIQGFWALIRRFLTKVAVKAQTTGYGDRRSAKEYRSALSLH
jgi:hypothetical protein